MKYGLTLFLSFCILSLAAQQQESSSRRILPTNPFGNPLIPDMVADPSITEIDGTFYCYVTTDGYGQGLETSGPPVVWKSRDFVNWSFSGSYFPQALHEKYWAPSKPVLYRGKWYIYPTVNGYMYPAVADSPDGPFRLAKGDSFTLENRLLERDSVCAIDTEIFIDDDGCRYALWGERNVATLKEDMVTIDRLDTLKTRSRNYTEGPIFFKRKGIYYYLYTNMALEKYEYFYQMSRTGPLGPYTTPKNDVVCRTDADAGVFGPGHGCVFNPEGTDDYYLVFLEFSRNSTNRQIYAGKLQFNEDGTIQEMKMSLEGVGALRHPGRIRRKLVPQSMTASSVASPEKIPYKLDKRCQRTEYFVPTFATDGSNGSRWMAQKKDSVRPWLTADFGEVKEAGISSIAFVRPTAGHAYRLEGSLDGKKWFTCGGHDDIRIQSPHCDTIRRPVRYLRATILGGVPGVWEWTVEEEPVKDFGKAKWIALEPDSTILFPHVHLLAANSTEGKSLKRYRMPLLSKKATIRKHVKKAWVDICGMGQYELTINGRKIGSHFLSPGWTMYDKELIYNEYDVTNLLRKLKSRELDIQVLLGGGMYDIPVSGYHKMAGSCGAPKLRFCLHIEYKDGTFQTIFSDQSWTARESGISHASIYNGEWCDATYSSTPQPAVLTQPHWDVPLVRQQEGTMICVHDTMRCMKIADGLYDSGQNAAGIVRIHVKGKSGKTISIKPAEILKDGKISQKSMPGYEWKYTMRGDKDGEWWQPSFSYTGFRYLKVEAEEGVELLSLDALHTTTETQENGHFECSDTLFNRIHNLIDWAIRSNMASITTDCPTREKLGWQEQNHLMAHSMMYRYDMRPLMNKIADDLADSQHPDGSIPTIAPEYTRFEPGSGFEDSPEWGASFILCPWYVCQWYGDDSAIRKHYDAMKRYMAYLRSRTSGNILDYGLGDWFDVGPKRPGKAQLTSVALTATATYYQELRTMVEVARYLGKHYDADLFDRQAKKVREAFNQRFFTGGENLYEQGSQTGLAMVYVTHLAPDSIRQQVADLLARKTSEDGYRITAGDVGFHYVVQALQQSGHGEVLFRMNHNDSIPGYAYQLKKGATALTESWQAYDNVSNNHLMLGHLMEWLYAGLGGISFDPGYANGSVLSENAWKHLLIRPQMVGNVRWANTSVVTPNGMVECKWGHYATGEWYVSVRIPEGTEAKVCLPNGKVYILDVTSCFYSSSLLGKSQ